VKAFQLFMLPFGGGNETSYAKFESYLDSSITMVNGEAPGKGRRIKEPLLKNIYLIAEEYYRQFKPLIKEPYAIYGHSMGAYLTHIITQRIREDNLPLPKHLFLTSKIAPSRNYNKKRSVMTNEQFITHLKELKGMPDAVLNNEELLQIFLPVIRTDFDAIDNYKYIAQRPYPVDMTVICGSNENVPDDQLTDWQKETSGEFHFSRWEGDHFWIFDHLPELCKLINHTLEKY
jgi:surfactin synthase thioesterase subunit